LQFIYICDIITFVAANLSFCAGGEDMAFSYNKLWKLMIDRKLMKKDLIVMTDITSSTMAKMGKDLPVSMEVLGRICKSLDVNIGDIVDYIDDEQQQSITQGGML